MSRCGPAVWFVSVGGVGLIPLFPGTLASALMVAVYAGFLYRGPFPVVVLAWVFLTGLGIFVSTRCVRRLHEKDPRFIVIDEVSGQWLALFGVPRDWRWLLLAFFLFRILDIVKPLGLRRLERLPEGWGIMFDDVGAGLLALFAVHILRWVGS